MSTNRDFDRIASGWLAEGPTELNDRVLDAALDEVHLTHQRRPIFRPWRFFMSQRLAPVRAVIALAAVVIVGVIVFRFGFSPAGVGGRSSPAASPSASVCLVTLNPGVVLNASSCPYKTSVFQPAMTLTADPVWAVAIAHLRAIELVATQPGSGTGMATEGLDVSTIDRVALQPCGAGNPPATRTYAATSDTTAATEFFAWLVANTPVRPPTPVAVTIDGHPGLETTFTLPAGSLAQCNGTLAFTDTGTETADTGGFDGLIDGDTWRLAVIGVGGKTVVFATFSPPDRAVAIDPPADRLIASVHFK